jgi:hypothetical protein
MRRAPTGPNRQQGAALLVLAAALVLGVATILVARVNEIGTRSIADHRKHNAAVLEHAKKALIGYVAMSAVQADEDNPGRLPCPESPSDAGTANEGRAGSSCAPAFPTNKNIGRLPWKTLGVDKLLDAHAEPLWYVVSPGWVYAGASLVINSNSTGQLTVDGEANTVVALIIAPDVAMNVEASAGCTAHNQTRSVPAAGINPLNYLECFNSASLTSFSTSGPSGSFNDQAVKITLADVLPAIEAAIAVRIERQIAPALKAIYTPGAWGFAGTEPVFPFAAPFADPSVSAMQGTNGTTQGLLPLSHGETSPGSGVACAPGLSDPRCNPTFVAWTGAASMSSPSTYSETCSVAANSIDCTFYYRCLLILCPAGNVPFTVNATAANVGMAMRRLNSAVTMTNVEAAGRTVSATLNVNGSATVALGGTTTTPGGSAGFLPTLLGNTLCGLSGLLSLVIGCKQHSLSIPVLLFADHSLLDSSTTGAGATGWYLRNRWHEVSYYAVAAGHTPAGIAATPSCTTATNCLTVANVAPSGAQRAMLILAGRSINGTARPSGTLADYLEFGNATAAFERQPVSTAATPTLNNPFNDRIVVVDAN